jgi:hypothetical protein
MNVESKMNEARRKEKSELKRKLRESRRLQHKADVASASVAADASTKPATPAT